jgi:type I restriction enzyme S subunit
MSWTTQRLDQLGYLSRGRSRHRPRDAAHLYDGPYPFIQTGDVKHAGLYITSYEQTYSEAGLEQSRLWPAGTLCITIATNIADTAILGIDACFPDSVIGFIPDEQKTDARFVKYLFDATIQRHVQQFTQGAAQDNLSQEKLLSIEFVVPGVTEQKRIANILSAYDDLIENNRRRMALLEDAARQLYREWFVRLRFPGHEHVRIRNGVPEGWSKGCVDDFYDTASGGTPSRKIPEYFTGEIPWVKTQELPNGFVMDTEEKITEDALANSSAKIFPERTVLIALYGATVGELGILASPSATNQACCAISPKDPRAHYIHSFMFFRENKEKLVSLSAGAAQNNISQQIVRAYEMVMPAKSLMEAFVESLNPAFEQWVNLQRSNQKLRAARDLLLPRLMSGQITV